MATVVAEKDPRLEELRLMDVAEDARDDPKALINEIRFFDPSTEEWVEFRMFPHDGWESPALWLPNNDLRFTQQAQDWYWQSVYIEWLHDHRFKSYLTYKARQLGITLLNCAYALWLMLFRPGSAIIAYSYTESEAKKLVEATWLMYESLPKALKRHVKVITPERASMPSEWIRLQHADGRTSSFQALPATKKHGHGTRITFAIMDEVAYMDYARDIYKAVNPAVSRGRAKLSLISTANGVSNVETGGGNFFHHLWATRKEKKLRYVFLPWNAEPSRDEVWYEEVAMKLDEVDRNQQYPLNENDGFRLSGAVFFNREGLDFYRENISHPLRMGQFMIAGMRQGKFVEFSDGIIEIYEEPRQSGRYGIGCDTATGKGADYTSATVIDLSSGAPVAHLHAKIEAPRAADQLHYLGHLYNRAKIAVERGGGYGDALIIALRDGSKTRDPYTNLYRHTTYTKAGKPMSEEYGFPMTEKGRAQVVSELASWIRQRLFPWLPAGHVDELETFVYADTKPSPRAQEGCNDDRVMDLGLGVELFRQYGQAPRKGSARRRWKKSQYQPPGGKHVSHAG